MPSNRAVVAALTALGVACVVGVAIVLLTRAETQPLRGDVIAYGCKEQANPWYAICLMRSDGSESERLTSKLPTTHPAWSPDGRRIAFTRNEDLGEFTKFTSDDVFVIDADGDDPTQLTHEQEGRTFGQPAWSPDGHQIAYLDGQSVSSAVPSRYGSLFVMDADGGDPHRLATGRTYKDPDWSPDGREIVLVRGKSLSSATESNDDLYVLDVSSGAMRALTRTPPGVYESAPAWSPEGSRIAVARTTGGFSDFGGTASIFVMNRDGTGETLVLEHKLFLDAPYNLSWSPDGRKIAFETSSSIGCTSISVVTVESRVVRPLTTCTRPRESTVAPAWHPAEAAEDR